MNENHLPTEADAEELESQIEVKNYSDWDTDVLTRAVNGIANELGIREAVWFVFQDKWQDIDDAGEPIEGTEQDLAFDGDAYDNGVVRVCVGRSMQYPFAYNINENLIGFYLRQVALLNDPYELFLYMAAHEMRHLWQWENPEEAQQISRLLKCDDETDADIYALMTLSRHRSGNTVHPFLRPQYNDDDQLSGYAFWCPVCGAVDPSHGLHVFTIKDPDGDTDQEWQFDGRSSFNPSLAYETEPYCHLHLTNGMLQYYPDCRHDLAGQSIEMVPIPFGMYEERA